MLTLHKNLNSSVKFKVEELMSRKFDHMNPCLCFSNKLMAVAVIGGNSNCGIEKTVELYNL